MACAQAAQCDLLSVCRLAGDVSALNIIYSQLLRAPAFSKTILNKTNQFGESAVLQAVRERDAAAVTGTPPSPSLFPLGTFGLVS